jgi:hypothetical protein
MIPDTRTCLRRSACPQRHERKAFVLRQAQAGTTFTKQIEERLSDTVADVKSNERIRSDSVHPALRPFRSVANLWVACFFGNDLPREDYEALIELLDVHPDKIHPWKNAAEFQ